MSKASLWMLTSSCSRSTPRPYFLPRTVQRAFSTNMNSQRILNDEAAAQNPKGINPFELGGRREDFKKREVTRPPFDPTKPIPTSRTPCPNWKYGQGFNRKPDSDLKTIEIDPNAPDRTMISNYKLLISAIPRPISFVSTASKDGKRNLAPFSYFQVVDHDPPIFVIGFSGRATRPKDRRRNLVETGECVISVVTEGMIEAVNATSLDVPHGVSEWEVAGFEGAESAVVKPERVKDAVFSIEAKLLQMIDLDYDGKHKAEGRPAGGLAVIEGKRFWVREDAIDEKKEVVSLDVMRPLVQLGGISYGRIGETFELPRPRLQEELEDESNGIREILDEPTRGHLK